MMGKIGCSRQDNSQTNRKSVPVSIAATVPMKFIEAVSWHVHSSVGSGALRMPPPMH